MPAFHIFVLVSELFGLGQVDAKKVRVEFVDGSKMPGVGIESRTGLIGQVDERDLVVMKLRNGEVGSRRKVQPEQLVRLLFEIVNACV